MLEIPISIVWPIAPFEFLHRNGFYSKNDRNIQNTKWFILANKYSIGSDAFCTYLWHVCVVFGVWHAIAKCPTTYQYAINVSWTAIEHICVIWFWCLYLHILFVFYFPPSNPFYYIRCTTIYTRNADKATSYGLFVSRITATHRTSERKKERKS